MNFEALIEMVIDYAVEYKCTIKESINDLEFDGPNGSEGPTIEDTVKLLNHFGDRVEMLVRRFPKGSLCYVYSEKYTEIDKDNIAELLSL